MIAGLWLLHDCGLYGFFGLVVDVGAVLVWLSSSEVGRGWRIYLVGYGWLGVGGERSCVIDVTVLVWVVYVVKGLTVFGFVGVSYVEVQVTGGDSVAYLSRGYVIECAPIRGYYWGGYFWTFFGFGAYALRPLLWRV